MEGIEDIAWLTALWLGVLTSISPCPLATNIAAVSFVGRHVGKPAQVLIAGALYSLGRIAAYVVLGMAAVWSLMSIVNASRFLQGAFHKLLGPTLIVAGLLLLGVFTLKIRGRGVSERTQERVAGAGVWGAFPLGAVFALAFCPVSAALFFATLIPLATAEKSPFLLPFLYGFGTGIPVVLFAIPIALGARWLGTAFNRLSAIELWARRVTGVVFLAVGVFEILRSFFHLV